MKFFYLRDKEYSALYCNLDVNSPEGSDLSCLPVHRFDNEIQTVLEQMKGEREMRERVQQDSLELARLKRIAEEELKVSYFRCSPKILHLIELFELLHFLSICSSSRI